MFSRNDVAFKRLYIFSLFLLCLLLMLIGIGLGDDIGRLLAGGSSFNRAVLGAVGKVFGLTMGLCTFAVALYALRTWNRLLYGLAELAVAGATILGAAASSYFGKQGQGFDFVLGDALPIAAAVYVLVRALDNIGEGLKRKNGGKYPAVWSKIFPEP